MAATALVCTSHSPLMSVREPGPGIRARVEAEFALVRDFITDFAPDLVVLFAPDHYNGIFYDMMPPYCIGSEAISVGDWGTAAGPLSVDTAMARHLTEAVLAANLDIALSMRLYVDHGFTQPLELFFGGIDTTAVVPVFINSVAEPLGPPRRAKLLGAAIGNALLDSDRRVLYLASGGLSHDPPAPRIESAPPEVMHRLLGGGRRLTPEEKAERERRVLLAGEKFALGENNLQPLNPEWDRLVLNTLSAGDLRAIDTWTTEWFTVEGGHSAHETRTWIAAYAALAASGEYLETSRFYEPIPEWIAGFGITTALPTASFRHS
ncbi:3-carboxyethylcatechol 2,3-dioxygenase [Rhodococcus wratislaviensis]|uniref:3-carboxyethylcatechol 2,3-dioxygenase n=1 Tax=Rhodococcus wratislaviensis TaxID=44752 RepID=UPI0035144958